MSTDSVYRISSRYKIRFQIGVEPKERSGKEVLDGMIGVP